MAKIISYEWEVFHIIQLRRMIMLMDIKIRQKKFRLPYHYGDKIW